MRSYEVEKVLKKRICSNEVQYLLKWVGYTAKYNTWERSNNLSGNELIDQFEKARECAIIGIKKGDQGIKFLLKFQADGELEDVSSGTARKYWPNAVISFYVNQIEWSAGNEPYTNERAENVATLLMGNVAEGDPIKIVYTDVGGELRFLAQWPNKAYEWIELNEASDKWPDLVIQFLEENISFNDE